MAAGGAPARRASAPDRARLAAVGAVLVLAPVLSPQYLVWLLPFAAVLAADAVVLALAAAASVLTAAVAHAYDDFVAGSPWWQWAVVTRNAVLVALVAVAFARLAAARRAPSAMSRRSQRPGAPTRPQPERVARARLALGHRRQQPPDLGHELEPVAREPRLRERCVYR